MTFHYVCRHILPAIILLCVLYGCSDQPTPLPERPSRTYALTLTSASSGEPIMETTVGTIVSDRRVDISSKLSGYIELLKIQEGDRVRAGDLLVKIDASEIESQIRLMQAAVTSAKAARHDADIDQQRYEEVFARGSLAENELRKIRLKAQTADQNLQQAQARLIAAEALRSYASVVSPVDGVIVEKYKEAGDMALPGTPILSLEADSGLVAETYVAASKVSRIKVGDQVLVGIDAIPTPLSGRVSHVVMAADPVTHTHLIKIALNESAPLMPGMFARISFRIGLSDVPVIPRSALTERGGLQGVYVVNHEQKISFRWLRIGREWPDRVEVTAGLKENELFVASATADLNEGDIVNPLEAAN